MHTENQISETFDNDIMEKKKRKNILGNILEAEIPYINNSIVFQF